ncbi:MAG: DNA alkylation repair protein [Mucispirillum sp.]|nr:DNA alkylation repair protein [Mucispirillum sp.]
MNLNEIKNKLQAGYDKDNAAFFSKVSPDAKNVTGVRVPYLRKLAKEIIKDDVKNFLDNYNVETHEEFLLKGIVIGISKLSLEEKFAYLEKFVPEIYDWSGCDIVISSFKFKDNELSRVYDFILRYRYSNYEYETRFMIIMLFNFIKADYLDKIKEILETEKFDKYYSQMAAAWLISAMFIKYRDYTLSYLNNNSLDNFTYNKALQKIRESNRVIKEDKELVKKMKRK